MKLRKNVIVLVGLGYATVMIGFLAMVFGGREAGDAYDSIKEPLMALIGGSLALSKDVLNADIDSS